MALASDNIMNIILAIYLSIYQSNLGCLEDAEYPATSLQMALAGDNIIYQSIYLFLYLSNLGCLEDAEYPATSLQMALAGDNIIHKKLTYFDEDDFTPDYDYSM